MKFCSPLLVVTDLARSRAFYREVFGLRVISDFGANITFTGGLSLQTKESWESFIHKPASEITFGGNDAELYFEEDDLDTFLGRLGGMDGIAGGSVSCGFMTRTATSSRWAKACAWCANAFLTQV